MRLQDSLVDRDRGVRWNGLPDSARAARLLAAREPFLPPLNDPAAGIVFPLSGRARPALRSLRMECHVRGRLSTLALPFLFALPACADAAPDPVRTPADTVRAFVGVN